MSSTTAASDVNILMQIKRLADRKIVVGQSNLLDYWLSYYQNNYTNLHYLVNTGTGSVIHCVKKSIGMPNKISQDLANYILNERCQIVVPKKAQDILNAFLKREKFWSKANKNYQQAMALSIGAWVEGIDGLQVDENGRKVGNGKVKMRFINAKKVYPLTAHDGEIVECAFVSNQTTHFNVEIHLLNEEGNYVVKTCKLSPDYATVQGDVVEFDTHSNIPLFQLVYPNLMNNLELNSPLPISIFANYIDILESIDEKYDDFDIEFKNGKKRIFVNSNLWKVDSQNGEVVKTFDTNDTVFYQLDFEDNSKPLIETSADPLRDESYIRAINADLNLLSVNLGFGRNVYNIQELTETSKTATEVKAMNNEMMNTIQKYELIVEDALIGMVKAVQYLSNNFTDTPLGEFDESEINIIFDDSIFDDKETEQNRDRNNIQTNLMSIVEYRMKWMGEDEKSAKAYVYKYLRHKLINDNLQGLTSGAMPPEVFVDMCYGDKEEEEKVKIIEYITEKMSQNSIPQFDTFPFTENEEEQLKEE